MTDIGGALQGGVGMAASGNIHPGRTSLFEPVHGSAPPLAGKNVANPMAMILSGVLMLRYANESAAADRIEKALCEVLAEKRVVTRDLGGTAGTQAFAHAVAEKLRS